MGPRGAVKWLVGGLALAVAGFAAETAFMFHADRLLDASVHRVQQGVLPAVHDLASIRKGMTTLASCGPAPGRGSAADVSACALAAQHRIEASVDAYAKLPTFPGRDDALEGVLAKLTALDRAMVELARSTTSPKDFDRAMAGAIATLGPLDLALDQVATANVAHTLSASERAHALMRRSETVELLLSASALVLATIATLLGLLAIRRYQRSLETRAEELERFGATVAHDLLSPLSSLGITMPVIQQRHPDDAQTQQLTRRAQSTVRRVRELVEALLEFARAGTAPAHGCADVGKVLADAVNELQEQAATARAQLEIEQAAGTAACSPGVLYSIVANLVTNALKYLGDAPERNVRLRARVGDERVIVEVEDTGPGVPPSLAEAIFDPYVRASSGKPGLGLGLATVKRLVLAHGGQVGVRTAPSGGALFWFQLPAAGAISSAWHRGTEAPPRRL